MFAEGYPGTNESGAGDPGIMAAFRDNNSDGGTLIPRYILSLLTPHHVGRFLSTIFSLLL